MKTKLMQNLYVGDIFETFVGILLNKLYPEYKFEHTQYKHDGGKDYYAVFDDEKVWAEAKCYNRHLELSRIAGTFIMAEIFKINRVIIFSESKLSKGALTNLTRYASMNMLTLIVYNDNDIYEMVKSFGEVSQEEKIATISNIDSNFKITILNSSIESLIKDINLAKQKDGEDSSYINSLLLACAYKKYEEYLKEQRTNKKNRGIKVVDNLYYKQSFQANPVPFEKEIKAFESFSVEIVLKNESLYSTNNVSIVFENIKEGYKILTNSSFSLQLEPCQCVCAKFYFKALNDSSDLNLPKPDILVNHKKVSFNLSNKYRAPISCWRVGEFPYIGKDNETLNNCCINLSAPGRKFTAVCVYGKSGMGKSRFLTELYYARQNSGNNCYFIKGENNRNSLYDFLRSIICGIYNFKFNEKDGEIVFPESVNNLLRNDKNIKNFEFINSILKFENPNKVDTGAARNWLVSILMNNHTTLLIDNAQFAHKDILEFLSQVCNDLQLCNCNSEIVFAFNTDFMISSSLSYQFLNHLKITLPEEYKCEITGFDENNAIRYLKSSLDPDNLREDIESLCKNIVSRLGCNPLYLKQIVLYLYQKEIIGFYNNAICVLNFERLQSELTILPESTYSLINLRYKTLIQNNYSNKDQINDLFWSVLIFDKFPKKFINCIKGYSSGLLKNCVELGFLKDDGETITFEHQLIEKAILISLQDDSYSPNPKIIDIGLSTETKKNFLKGLKADKYATVKFAIEYSMDMCDKNKFAKYVLTINLNNATDEFIPYIVDAAESCIRDYNEVLPAQLKIDAIYRLITVSQNKLGVQSTQILFKEIIEFQVRNFKLNHEYDEDFIELLKFYIYELPSTQKCEFILEVQDIGIELLTSNNKSTDDFIIWIYWALGKSYMHVHDFKKAFEYLDKGEKLAKGSKNFHRLAELNVQLGYLSAYQMQKEKTKKYWKTASKSFNKSGIYDEVLALVYKGNVMLLNNYLDKTDEIINKLLIYYERNECYPFLKSTINDFICNKLILQFVKNDMFDANLDHDIKTRLNEFRSQTITYNLRAYMLALYKTLTYLKYINKNFSESREKKEKQKDVDLEILMGIELIANYDYATSDFNYFYPIFKDIAEIHNFDKCLSEKLSEKFQLLQDKSTKLNLNYPIKFGVLSDENHKVNLFHYSYTW